MNATAIRFICFALAWTVGLATGAASDWPMYKHDACRSGVTDESLTFPLSPAWVYRFAQPSKPAWLGARKNLNRLGFDGRERRC